MTWLCASAAGSGCSDAPADTPADATGDAAVRPGDSRAGPTPGTPDGDLPPPRGAATALEPCERGLCRDPAAEPYANWPEPLETMSRGSAHTATVCARGGGDLVLDVFCSDPPPRIASLPDLQAALGVAAGAVPFADVLNDYAGVTGISIAGHSTALSTRSVSSLNPRVIVVQLEVPGEFELLTVAFVRGEQSVEIIVRDRDSAALTFYVVGYRQACNEAPGGCLPGDLLTPQTERDWTEVTLYDEADVRNTVLDCAPCHQPEGPDTPKILRMRELETPWTHWFFNSTDGGMALLEDYQAAKGDEPLAGMSARQVAFSHPGNLNMIMTFGGHFEPHLFPSAEIEAQVTESAASMGGEQPHDNAIPGESSTWSALYEQFRQGQAPPVPYHDVKVTDADKLKRMTEAYTAYRRGEIEQDQLPDIRDVLPDDPKRLAAMGMMTDPGLPGEGVLLQACGQCHNGQLDQTLSRARFRADLVGMDRAAKDRAVARLRLPETDPLAMPPAKLRRLTAEARSRAIAVLEE